MINTNSILVTTTRGPIVENRHNGSAAIVTAQGDVVESWGDITAPLLPRSAVKMLQALPLMESGAAAAFSLTPEHLSLSCASHEGAAIHTDRVGAWLSALGLTPDHLRCGPQPPRDPALRAASAPASRLLNNCSGKHTGFLTYAKHMGMPLETYLDTSGPVQNAVGRAFAEMTGADFPLSYGVDGCSAPNFISSVEGVASAMALFADPSSLGPTRAEAAIALRDAMRAHPLLMSGEGRACAHLITATDGRAIVKTGADGVYTGIIPEKSMGFCLKIDDGNRAASEALCGALLVRLGVLNATHPMALRYTQTPIQNFNGEIVGQRHVTLDA